MYCIKCGKKLNEGAKYCYYCGTKVGNTFEDNINDIYEQAKETVIRTGKTGVAFLSKELNIANDKVKELLNKMEEDNIVSPLKGNRREVIKKDETLEDNKTNILSEEIKTEFVRSDKQIFESIISYIGILVLIPLFTEKDDGYIRFHAKQGINLLILEVIYVIVSNLLSLIKVKKAVILFDSVNAYQYATPSFITFIIFLFGLCIFALVVIGIYNACLGRKKELPFIGKIEIVK